MKLLNLIGLLAIFLINIQYSNTCFGQSVKKNQIETRKQILENLDSVKHYIELDYLNALYFIDKAYQSSIKIKDTVLLAKSLMLKGRMSHLNGNSEQGRELLFKSLNLAKVINDDLLLAQIYDNIGLNLRNNHMVDDAVNYYNKSMVIRQNHKDTSGIINLIINLACIQRDEAFMNKDKDNGLYLKKMNNNFNLLDSALRLLDKRPDDSKKNEIYFLKANCYIGQLKFKKSLKYLNKFIEYERKIKKRVEPNNYLFLAEIYYALQKEKIANKYLDSAIMYFDETTSRADEKWYYFYRIANIYSSIGNYKEAFEKMKILTSLTQEVMKNNSIQSISRAQAQYEINSKENKAKMLNYKNQIQKDNITKQSYVILFFGLLIIIILIMLYYLYRGKKIADEKKNIINIQNDKIKESIMIKDKFYSVLAHDVKNSLIGSRLLLSNIIYNDSVINLEKIKDLYISNHGIINLLDNLLEWIQIQTGQKEGFPSEITIRSICKEVIEMNKVLADNKAIKIDCSINHNLTIIFDERMFYSIVQNLLTNAIKNSNNESVIKIFVKEELNYIILSISDKGVGIKEEFLNHLKSGNFSIGENQNEYNGTGLGLKICRDFIEFSGGELEIESEKGIGSTFSFTIPK